MSRIKFEDFYSIFQDRVSRRLTSQEIIKNKYQDGIACLCISKDDSIILMGAIDGSVIAYNLSTSPGLTTLYKASGSETEITAIAITSDNKDIIFASSNGSVGIFNLPQKKIKYFFEEVHQDAISSLALTKDNEYAVSGCRDGSIGIFDLDMETRTDCIQHAHDDAINSITLCSDDQYIVSASDDRSIRIFSFEKRRLLYVMDQAHHSGITSLAVTSDTKYIISASNDSTKSLKVYDLKTKELAYTFEESDSPITALALSTDDKYIIAGCIDRSVRVYDLQRRQTLFTFEDVHDDPITTLAITHNKDMIASACYDGSFHILDLRNKDLVQSYKPHQEKITCIIVTQNNNYIISASRDANIHIYNFKNMEICQTIPKSHKGPITGLALAKDDELLVSASRDKSINFYNLKTLGVIYTIQNAHDDPITTLAITSNSSHIITAAEDLSIKMFDFDTKTCIHTFHNAQEYPGSSIVITKDDKHIISESLDRSLHIFDLEKRKKVCSFANKTLITTLLVSPEIPLCLSKDNRIVLFQMHTNAIGVYNFERMELSSTIENCCDGTLTALAITARYDYVITGSSKGSLFILDSHDHKKIYSIENAHNSKITTIILFQKDKFIISGDAEGTINVFNNPLSTREILALDASLQSTARVFDLMILSRFIIEDNVQAKIEIIRKYPQLQVYPYRWNFFHLVAKFFSRRELIVNCVRFQLPLLIDSFNHTALHYLLNKRETDFGLINCMLESYSDLILKQPNKDDIIRSLTPDLPSILKLGTPQAAYFLRIGVGRPQTYGNQEIPNFGNLRDRKDIKFLVSKYLSFSPEVKAALLHTEDENSAESKPAISISVLKFQLNYLPYSKDMLHLIHMLNNVKNEEIFQSKLTSILTQYLWSENKIFHYFLTAVFSVLMILLSVYSALEDRNLTLEIIILSLSMLYMFYEIFQLHFTPLKVYVTQIWNVLNVIFNAVLIVTIVLQWIDISELTKNWLISISLFIGYLKWISFFRVIDQTRKLIRMILEVIKAIRSFIFILIFLIFGFSLIFYQFDREKRFDEYLLLVYNLIYNNSDTSEFSAPQLAYFVLFTILLSVILLNLLIAIMGDTYEKVQTKSILAEGREKISLILEATVIIRAFKRICKARRRAKEKIRSKKQSKKLPIEIRRDPTICLEYEENKIEKPSNKGYLFYVRTAERDFDYTNNLFGINYGKGHKRLHDNPFPLIQEEDVSEFSILKSHYSEIRTVLDEQEKRIKDLEKVVKTNFEEMEKKLKGKMDEILTAVLEDNPNPTGRQRKFTTIKTTSKKLTQKDLSES